MAFASGSNHGAFYVAEVIKGTTPATPAFKPLRNTGITLGLSKDSIQSEEIRQDRQIACYRHGNRQVGGDASIEFVWADFDDMLEAATCGTWTANVLKVGTVRRSFTVERFFSDISTRIRYTGCEVNNLSLSIAPNAVVTGTIGFVGVDQDPSNTQIAGSTYATAQGGCPFDSFSGTISEGGSPIGSVTSVELSLENSIEQSFVVGSKVAAESTIGRSNITGTATVYFENMTMLNKFVNETASSLDLVLVNEAGDQYEISLPTIKYTGGQPDVSGEGSISLSMPFQALYNAGAGSNIVITRTPA